MKKPMSLLQLHNDSNNFHSKKDIICLSNVIGDSVGKSDSKQTLAFLSFLKKDKHHKILQTLYDMFSQ